MLTLLKWMHLIGRVCAFSHYQGVLVICFFLSKFYDCEASYFECLLINILPFRYNTQMYYILSKCIQLNNFLLLM